MAKNYQAAIAARTGKVENGFPFLSLPPEIRNIIYRQSLLKHPFITSLRQPGLLCTNRQIRGEALAMYYARNSFYLIMIFRGGQVLQKVQRFVRGVPQSIEKHVQDIKFSIHQQLSDLGPYNQYLRHLLGRLPFGFVLRDGKVRNTEAGRTDCSSARDGFISRLLTNTAMLPGDFMRELPEGVFERELLPLALELFGAAWILAHTFPNAAKSITTMSHLPLGHAFTIW